MACVLNFLLDGTNAAAWAIKPVTNGLIGLGRKVTLVKGLIGGTNRGLLNLEKEVAPHLAARGLMVAGAATYVALCAAAHPMIAGAVLVMGVFAAIEFVQVAKIRKHLVDGGVEAGLRKDPRADKLNERLQQELLSAKIKMWLCRERDDQALFDPVN